MKWLLGLIINAAVLMGISYLFTGIELSGFGAAIIASLLLSLMNTVVRPILVFFTLPVTVLTLGLFLFVISGITLMITAFIMGDAFIIDGFGTAVLAAVLIALIQTFVLKPLKRRR